MVVSDISIQDLLSGARRYFVPPYQRPYQWDKDKAEELISDIYESFCNHEEDYFIGSIICIKSAEKSNYPYEVVDGQQRLITLSLILLELAKESNMPAELSNLLGHMVSGADVNSPIPIPRIKARESEEGFYSRHIIEKDRIESVRKLNSHQKVFTNNLKKIGEFLSSQKLEEKKLRDFTIYIAQNVHIVFVQMEDRMSSFRLFNVLNNRGMPLSQADLVKNELFSKANKASEQLYEQVKREWLEIENLSGEENLNGFLTIHQISEKRDRDRVKQKNYKYYSELLKNDSRFDGDSGKMSRLLLRSAEHYRHMLDGEYGGEKIIKFLVSLSKEDEWAPAFMAFLNKNEDKSKFLEFVELFEKIYMQGVLSRESKSKRDAACYYTVEAINNEKSFDEIMKVLLDFADNERLEQSLDMEEFYDGSRPLIINLVKSVLFRMDADRHDSSMKRDYPDWKKVQVEHILPQNRKDKYWTTRFTEDEHQEWVHKLGNLTLLARSKNAAGKNYGFDKKREKYEELQSPFHITRELCDLQEWNMENLQNRHEQLKKEIMDLWQVNGLV